MKNESQTRHNSKCKKCNTFTRSRPVRTVVEETKPSLDVDVKKIRATLGVIAMICESHPNVIIDTATPKTFHMQCDGS
jgi:gamma-glutamyl phosphate reductase